MCGKIVLSKIFFPFHFIAWYDYDLVGYQKERQDTELEKTFEERERYLKEKGINISDHQLKPKIIRELQTEWQAAVKEKKSNEDYLSKLSVIEQEQILREQKIREQSHQYAIPGEKVLKASQAKDMAAKYEESL